MMKKICLPTFLFFNFFFYGIDKPAEYYILSSKEDKTLKKTEAVFILTFFNYDKITAGEITYSYNGKEKKQKLDSTGKLILKVAPGKYLFNFFYNFQHEEITTDSILIKPGYKTKLQINFTQAHQDVPMKKPVIYVYPTQTKNISLKLDLKGAFDFTYPEYKNGWDFVGHPDGGIEMNGKKYHYLFWDGKLNIDISKINFNEGFIVNKKNLVTFFESKLNQMGLKSNEIEDFITYWCPIMMANENNFVHFMFNDEYDYYAKLNVTPKPDAIFRVSMLWMKAANADDGNLKQQKLESFTRSGFTIVEWGGAEIENSKPKTHLE